MPENNRRELETLAAAAERCGVSSQTIRRRIAEGQITGYRFGPRLLRVDPAEVDAAFRPLPTTALQDAA